MPTETTVSYHFIPISMGTVFKKTRVGNNAGNWVPSNTAGTNIKKKIVRQFLEKLNTEIPYAPEIPLLGICPGEIKAYVHTKAST